MGQAHQNAAADLGAEAAQAQLKLDQLRQTLEELRGECIQLVSLKIDADSSAAEASVQKLKALTEAMELTAQIKLEVSQAEQQLDALQDDVRDRTLEAQVKLSLESIDADFGRLVELAGKSGVDIPAGLNLDAARETLNGFRADLQTALGEPTSALHTPKTDLSDYYRARSELEQTTTSTHVVTVQQVQGNALGGPIRRFADGGRVAQTAFRRLQGRISGPGTATSDSIPALLSQGEFVVRAASVRKFGEGFFAALNAGFLPPIPHFADGGVVAAQAGMAAGVSSAPTREVVDLRFHIGGKAHTVQSSRETAMQLAQALRELSRAG